MYTYTVLMSRMAVPAWQILEWRSWQNLHLAEPYILNLWFKFIFLWWHISFLRDIFAKKLREWVYFQG